MPRGKLQSFVWALGNGSDLWVMPVLDGVSSRIVIRSSVEDEVRESAQRVIAELAKMLERKGEVSE